MVAALCCYCLVQKVDLCRSYKFELQKQKHDRAYSVREFRRKMCVIMKCNTVLLGRHIDTVNISGRVIQNVLGLEDAF